MVLQAGLGSAGGVLALVFIVGLAVGIVTLTLFYLGSAILVLERFARVQHRKGSVFVFFVGTTILVATHDEMLVDRSKRPVIRMPRGRATAKDAASDFLNDAAPAGGGRQARGGIRREARR